MQDKRDALEAKSKIWYTAHPNSFIVPHHESAEQRSEEAGRHGADRLRDPTSPSKRTLKRVSGIATYGSVAWVSASAGVRPTRAGRFGTTS